MSYRDLKPCEYRAGYILIDRVRNVIRLEIFACEYSYEAYPLDAMEDICRNHCPREDFAG